MTLNSLSLFRMSCSFFSGLWLTWHVLVYIWTCSVLIIIFYLRMFITIILDWNYWSVYCVLCVDVDVRPLICFLLFQTIKIYNVIVAFHNWLLIWAHVIFQDFRLLENFVGRFHGLDLIQCKRSWQYISDECDQGAPLLVFSMSAI